MQQKIYKSQITRTHVIFSYRFPYKRPVTTKIGLRLWQNPIDLCMRHTLCVELFPEEVRSSLD